MKPIHELLEVLIRTILRLAGSKWALLKASGVQLLVVRGVVLVVGVGAGDGL